MAIRKKRGTETPGGNWMLTYGCLMTQLLVFFVMLFALASAKSEDQLKYIQKRVRQYIFQNHYEKLIHDEINVKGLVISISSELMFKSGEAGLASAKAKKIMEDLFSIFLEYTNMVAIEGHTDNRRIQTPLFPSNWELSTARATTLTRYLLENKKFDPKRVTSSGYGEFHPVATNDTVEGRSRNRRVDVIVRRLGMAEYKEMNRKRKEAAKKVVSVKE